MVAWNRHQWSSVPELVFVHALRQIAETMGSSVEVLREQMIFLLEQGLHDSAEMLVFILAPGFMV